MKTLRTSEAASYLNVSANTLRVWERKFGFPRATHVEGRRRLYPREEVLALREALSEGLAIESAVSVARDTRHGDARSLVAALASFEAGAADQVLDASLAVRSVEETLGGVLWPALDYVDERRGRDSAVWAFATGWAEDWLVRSRRLTAPPCEETRVLIGDATELALDSLRLRALALILCCRQVGLTTLMLSTRAHRHLGDMVAIVNPDVLVIVGRPDEAAARWGYQVSQAAGGLTTFLYDGIRRDGLLPDHVLPDSPVAAATRLRLHTSGRR